jgi:hypothetical protein
MIKLTSFYPFSNFLRITQEFYEDKVVVKAKSLSFEREAEFTYNEIGEISDSYHLDNDQRFFSFWLLAAICCALVFFYNTIHNNLVLLRSVQTLYICGLLLFATSFIKRWYIIISDKHNNILTNIKQTHSNREMIMQVTEMIKSKSENIQEITSADPFPETKPAFEYTYYNISNPAKATDKFYENEVIGFTKSLFSERAYSVKYNVLSGKIYKGKIGIYVWESTFPITIFAFSIMFGINWGFSTLPRVFFLYTGYAVLAILLITWLLTFVKREVMGFYNKKGNIEYWAYVNRADKDKVEEIIKYVQSRIPAENKEIPFKE